MQGSYRGDLAGHLVAEERLARVELRAHALGALELRLHLGHLVGHVLDLVRVRVRVRVKVRVRVRVRVRVGVTVGV